MNIYEEAVLNYITSDNNRFINPQFNIEYYEDEGNKIGGSLPDFVVLDFKEKTVYIVEVTQSYDLLKLFSKVNDRENRWIRPIKETLDDSFKYWDYHVTLYEAIFS